MTTTYKSLLDRKTTETAIQDVKDIFSNELARRLELTKVSAPLMVLKGTGINDDLNGTERAVSFPVKALDEQRAEVVHSLAKWKRVRLKELEIAAGYGLYTNMFALRPDEELTPIHSIFVDQWDWEKHMSVGQRSLSYLKDTVTAIYEALKATEQSVCKKYTDITAVLPDAITFIHSEDLQREYPALSPKERENKAALKYGAIFLIGIGGDLPDGKPHDGRAPDYDDWITPTELDYKGLNGDIIVWNPVLERAFELSSMGIRVDEAAMERQLVIAGCEKRAELSFHKSLLDGLLPQSIGGGIGQSRVCMFMMRKSHIGEVQVSIWPEKLKTALQEEGIELL